MTADDGDRKMMTRAEADPVVVLARYRPGAAGEIARMVHMVPHPGGP